MASPKRRTSKHKQRLRRGANRWRKPNLQTCSECGTRVPGHIACPSCGTYRDRQVLDAQSV